MWLRSQAQTASSSNHRGEDKQTHKMVLSLPVRSSLCVSMVQMSEDTPSPTWRNIQAPIQRGMVRGGSTWLFQVSTPGNHTIFIVIWWLENWSVVCRKENCPRKVIWSQSYSQAVPSGATDLNGSVQNGNGPGTVETERQERCWEARHWAKAVCPDSSQWARPYSWVWHLGSPELLSWMVVLSEHESVASIFNITKFNTKT